MERSGEDAATTYAVSRVAVPPLGTAIVLVDVIDVHRGNAGGDNPAEGSADIGAERVCRGRRVGDRHADACQGRIDRRVVDAVVVVVLVDATLQESRIRRQHGDVVGRGHQRIVGESACDRLGTGRVLVGCRANGRGDIGDERERQRLAGGDGERAP